MAWTLLAALLLALPGQNVTAAETGTYHTTPPFMNQPYTWHAAGNAVPLQAGTSGAGSTMTRREERSLSAARWAGIAAGSLAGVASLYWNAVDVSGVNGSFGQAVLTTAPSILMGSYIGERTAKWMARGIMARRPGPGRAVLWGALYGAAGGAVILTASLVPLFLTGYCLDTMDFNMDPGTTAAILGAAVLGGSAYGATFGCAAGMVGGPCISLYVGY